MIDYRDQIATMLKSHLISIFLAIYFHNIGDETSAYEDQYPKICRPHDQITCKSHRQCNDKGELDIAYWAKVQKYEQGKIGLQYFDMT